ncbi:tRNA lysidine(34) synthetase TilS [Microscilla marina]|uniref:tRNA(Ile)-lysidine synthase n=1 Tax=Microscilla marina ATCC 23134 TaxID=313606 RepID=A1ZPL4_MICM2|nr:tRNA lysidine(34) synthetase TilS [Microscilla marina]EAY27753.1 tRNA(Ile)-lysidine synthase (tRNA(Ile)-lysidinesynthetase) (tRNA(Ile)-2-lysyl-cytidine synthase) [Microscilla marina ATCC 23134]
MFNKLITYITHKKIFTPQDNILLAVSGGIDSVVLTDLFAQIKSHGQVAIAHCNFQLRGVASEEDEEFVKQLAQHYGIPCFVTRFDTYTLAQAQKGSIQMIARNLRYAWFEQLRTKEGYHYLATAHHQNDMVETVLLNLVRGTGIAGLHGIKVKQGHIIRPMLFASREEIEAYAQEKGLKWCEDASNQDNKYYRNRLRNEVIPVLKTMNPNLEKTLEQSVEKISAVERFFEAEVQHIETTLMTSTTETVFLDLKKLEPIDEKLIILYHILKKFGFSYIQTQDILAGITGESGKQFLSPTYVLVKDRNKLVITPARVEEVTEKLLLTSLQQNAKQLYTPLQLQLERKTVTTHFKLPKDPCIACLDWDKLKLPLKIRPWQQGDWFKPLGMNQRKKLSDFLIDQKIPINLKQKVMVVVSDQEIVWVVGYRLDNRYKLTKDTKEILLMSLPTSTQ